MNIQRILTDIAATKLSVTANVNQLFTVSAAPVSMDGQESKLVKTAYTDPYVTLSYGGTKARTSLEYSNYNPVFMEDVLFNIEVGDHLF